MDIDVFAPHELPTVLRVLRTALEPFAPLEARARSFLDTYAHIAGCAPLREVPHPIAGHQVRIEGAHQRKRLVQLAALAVLLGNPVKSSSLLFLEELAGCLLTHDPVIDVLKALQAGRTMRARLLAMRRAFRALLNEAWQGGGAMGVARFIAAAFLRWSVKKDKLWKYKRLGLLPEGTLGREYWKHMTTVGSGFPGEAAGIPDSRAYYDIIHVLAEHETTPLGEIQQGAFQAGNRREHGFFIVQFVILHFHHGIRITPTTPPTIGLFQPDKVLWALHRGAQCNVDMTREWDFWPLMALPIEEVRARCGLLPKLSAAAALRLAA